MSAVNTPTITLADNQDGTGAVATVAGSTSGSTNTIFAAQWAGGFVGQSYASYGSRTADGTVSLALGLGYWFVYCGSTKAGLDSAISKVVGVRVTDAVLSIYEQCIDAITAKIQALTLPPPWLPATVVGDRKFPWNRGFLNDSIDGAIFVTPLNDKITPALNQADDWGLGVQVTAAQKSNDNLTEGLSADLLCRQQLCDALLPRAGEAALAGVPEVYNVVIEPGPVIDPGAFQQNFDVGAIVARCITRRARVLA